MAEFPIGDAEQGLHEGEDRGLLDPGGRALQELAVAARRSGAECAADLGRGGLGSGNVSIHVSGEQDRQQPACHRQERLQDQWRQNLSQVLQDLLPLRGQDPRQGNERACRALVEEQDEDVVDHRLPPATPAGGEVEPLAAASHDVGPFRLR